MNNDFKLFGMFEVLPYTPAFYCHIRPKLNLQQNKSKCVVKKSNK